MSTSYPYITKNSSRDGIKTISSSSYSSFQYGEIISGSNYPYSSSVVSEYYVNGQTRNRIDALKNTLNYYKTISGHYAFSSSYGDKATQAMRFISIPSLYYGSSIKKGSLKCKFYVSGTLAAELNDINRNGEMIQVSPSGSLGSGSVAGVVLYKEGFILLTGSWDLHSSYTDNFNIYAPASSSAPSWLYFFTTGSTSCCKVPSSSFGLEYEGTTYTPTLTMFAHAEKGEMNHSNNPTYVEYGQESKIAYSSSYVFRERDNISIKNIVSASYTNTTASFEKTTYISKVALYDEERNLIGIAKLANPVRKREKDSYTIKIKMDL